MHKISVTILLIAIAIIGSSFIAKKPKSSSLVYPVFGTKSRIGSFWGDTRDGGKRKHEGIDIFAKKGTPVVAISDGIIVSKGNGGIGGKTVWLQPFKHSWKAYYAHLDEHKVKNGQVVKKGEVIGTVGNTGNAKHTPAHLHFGIYKWFGGAVNPLALVKNSRKMTVPLSQPNNDAMARTETKRETKNTTTTAKYNFPAEYISRKVTVVSDPKSSYYVTVRSNFVRVKNGQLEVLGHWSKNNDRKHPYKLTLRNNQSLFVKRSGQVVTAGGKHVATVMKIT